MSFLEPVSRYMTREVATVGIRTTLAEVAHRLDERRISAVPVVDEAGMVVGVVSRFDLVHAGRVHAGVRPGSPVLVLPELACGDVIKRTPLVCAPSTPLRDAARAMVSQKIHRLFVLEDEKLVGVISAHDLARAVRDERIATPIANLMSTPVITVRAAQPISVAIDRLDRAHLTGVVVVDDDWPIGVFTQIEALASRDLPRDTPVDGVLDPSIICMPTRSQAHHAAAQATRMDVRRVIACADREAVGMVSGLDFARLAAA